MSFLNHIGDENYRSTRKWLFFIILVVILVADFLAPREHGEFPWENIPDFDAFYGFIACAVLILFSKWLGHHWLMKKEDYYD